MNKNRRSGRALWTAISLIAVPLMATAKDVKLTYVTMPAGASLIQEGQILGETPYTLTYKVPDKWKECVTLRSVTLRWVSGAEITDGVTVCPKNGKKQQVQFDRPSGVPGLDVDAGYAVQLRQLESMEKRRRSEEYARFEALMRGIREDNAAQERTLAAQRALHCISQVVGNVITTTCR